jgi:hypothetical protein
MQVGSGLYAYLNVFMEDHVNGVIRIAKRLYGGDVPEWFYVPLAFHDFGKATKYFQEYLLSGKKTSYRTILSCLRCIV